LPLELRNGVRDSVLAACDHGDVHAVARESARNRAADALGRARHDRDATSGWRAQSAPPTMAMASTSINSSGKPRFATWTWVQIGQRPLSK